jgi:hypothetical protein
LYAFEDLDLEEEPGLLALDSMTESGERLAEEAKHVCLFSYPRFDTSVVLLEFTSSLLYLS